MERRDEILGDMRIDLQPTELFVLVILANMGHAAMTGDRESVQTLGNMLFELPDSETTAMSALQKLEASMKLAAAMTLDASVPMEVS